MASQEVTMRSVPTALALACLAIASTGATAAAQSCSLLATDASAGNILSVSTTTGAGAVIGPHGAFTTLPSLATDPTTGIIYGGSGQGVPDLYTINPATGMATFVGSTGLGFSSVGGMAFDAAGTLYAAVNILNNGGSGGDHLATINTATGLATIIGPFGTCFGGGGVPCTIEGMESITYDASGTLYGVVSARGSMFSGAPAGLYTINPATGVAAFSTALLNAAGAPASGGFVSIEFCPCDGLFYGGTASALAGADGGFLATINVTTGAFAFLGPASATFGTSLGGLALQLTSATSMVRNGSGVNPVVFSQTSPAVIGGVWKASVALGGAAASAVGVSVIGPTTFASAFGELLILPPFLAIDIAAGTHCIPIPNDCTIVGLPVFTQGATAPPVGLTNALDLTLGDF